MEPEIPAPPPEAVLIRTAREAAGMTAAQAAQASEGAVSATYWRDVERGYGGRRGLRAPARASARTLAAMARVAGVTPEQLDEAHREDAARVLREIERREEESREPARLPSVTPPAGVVVPLSIGGDEETVVRTIVDLPSPGGGLVPWETRREMLRSLLDINDRRRAEGLTG